VDERRFTAAEANALLDQLRPLCQRARELAARLRGREAAQALAAIRGGNGGGQHATGVVDAAGELRRTAERITELGAVLRDPTTGLIDFPADRSGKPIFLCWRLGEEQVAWWHDRETGFAGRQPLD
jgi:hypothetical protein